MGPTTSRAAQASHQASMRARVTASSGYSEHGLDETRKRAMALDSKMHVPSGVSSTGTLPKGFFARNSGVLLSTPIVNGAISRGTPAQPAAALTRSERPVQPYSFMLCGRSGGWVRRRRRRRGGRDPRGASEGGDGAPRPGPGCRVARAGDARARWRENADERDRTRLDACASAREAGRPGRRAEVRTVGWSRVRTMVSCGHRGERNYALSRGCVRSLSRRASL